MAVYRQVGDDDVRAPPPIEAEALGEPGRGEDLADVHPLEKLAAALDHHRMIVDDENSHAPRFRWPQLLPDAPSAAG